MRHSALAPVVLLSGCGLLSGDGQGGIGTRDAGEDAASVDGGANDGAPDATPERPLWLAYLADQDAVGKVELYMVDLHGPTPGPAVKVNDAAVTHVDDFPRWSRDGRRLAYAGSRAAGQDAELFAVEPTLAGPGAPVALGRPLGALDYVSGNGAFSLGFDWSPDSSRLYHGGRHDGVAGVYLVDPLAPGASTLLTEPDDGGVHMGLGAWSPSSDALSYGAGDRLFAVALDGAKAQVSPPLAGARAQIGRRGYGEWSADGRWLGFQMSTSEGATSLHITAMEGAAAGATHRVSGEMVAGGDIDDGAAPYFSPDGKKLLYRADQEVDGRFELYLVDVGGAAPGPAIKINQPVAGAGVPSNSSQPGIYLAWSPDSRRIAYLARRVANDAIQELWTVDVSGATPGAPVRVGPEATEAAGSVLTWFRWSPDGEAIALLTRTIDDSIRLSLVEMSDPGVASGVGGADLACHTAFEWSPDSQRIAASCSPNPDVLEFFVAERGAPATVTRVSGPLGEGGRAEPYLVWLPDARRVVVEVRPTVPGPRHLYLADLDGDPAAPMQVTGDAVPGGYLQLGEFFLQPSP